MQGIRRVVVLGAGYTGTAVLRRALALGLVAVGTTRSPVRAQTLSVIGAEIRGGVELGAAFLSGLALSNHDHVVITYPPDGATDARVAPLLAGVGALTYLSSTGVYGAHRGVVDDDTPLPSAPRPADLARLTAEQLYREMGATVLRCPGIYGPERGLHQRLLAGVHRIPGDGSNYTSRIHVEDLAMLVLASAQTRGETFVVGDMRPATQIEVVRWLCTTHDLPMPPSVPLAEVHETLQADRRVDPSRALRCFGVSLQFPTFLEGMAKLRA